MTDTALSPLFETLVSFRDAAIAAKRSNNGASFGRRTGSQTSFVEPEQPEDMWRPEPVAGTGEPWLNDPVWPASIRTTHCRTFMLIKGQKWTWWRRDDVTDPEYRAGCTGCGWLGEPSTDYDWALGVGLDHSHPGWRDMPAVEQNRPGSRWDEAEWGRRVARLYPAGWFETGGPVRTIRHSEHDMNPQWPSIGGGYDVPAELVPSGSKKADKVRMMAVETTQRWYEMRDSLVLTDDGIVSEAELNRPTAAWSTPVWDDDDMEDDEWDG